MVNSSLPSRFDVNSIHQKELRLLQLVHSTQTTEKSFINPKEARIFSVYGSWDGATLEDRDTLQALKQSLNLFYKKNAKSFPSYKVNISLHQGVGAGRIYLHRFLQQSSSSVQTLLQGRRVERRFSVVTNSSTIPSEEQKMSQKEKELSFLVDHILQASKTKFQSVLALSDNASSKRRRKKRNKRFTPRFAFVKFASSKLNDSNESILLNLSSENLVYPVLLENPVRGTRSVTYSQVVKSVSTRSLVHTDLVRIIELVGNQVDPVSVLSVL